MKNSVCGKDNCCHNPAQCASESSTSTLPGLPVSKKTKTSAEAMKEATAKISDSLDEAREALRSPFIKFAEDIKALEPLFEVMNEEHAKRVLAFLEAASNGMGVALQKEMEHALS